MAISDKTRKVLWGRSGNRCAVCRRELVADSTPRSDDSVVGDECHIVSGKALGPRYDPTFPEQMLDQPANLVLLCRVHHKMVDDQFETYSVSVLETLKKNHEQWVSTTLGDKSIPTRARVLRIKANIPTHLARLTSGRDIFNLIGDGHAYTFDQDELKTEQEVEMVASFFQEAQDWGDISADLEAGDRVKAAHRLTSLVDELKEAGLLVFGAREVRRLEGGEGPPQPFIVVILRVVRATSLEIIKVPVDTAARSEVVPASPGAGARESEGDV